MLARPFRSVPMRGDYQPQGMMFATVVLWDCIPTDHPLRAYQLTWIVGRHLEASRDRLAAKG